MDEPPWRRTDNRYRGLTAVISMEKREPAGPGPLMRLGVAAAAAGAALAVRWALFPILGESAPYIQNYPAIMVSAWYGGLAPGLITTLLCAGAATIHGTPAFAHIDVQQAAGALSMGMFVGIGALISALTESLHRSREQAELAARRLRASEARARHLAESSIVGVCFFDADGRVIEANDSFLELARFTFSDLRSRLLTAEGLLGQETTRAFAEIRETGYTTPVEAELRRKDGGRVPVLIGLSPAPEGDASTVAFVLDLTERRRVERKQAAQNLVWQIVAQAESVEAAAPRILRAVAESHGWDFAAFWVPGAEGNRLRQAYTWHEPENAYAALQAAAGEYAQEESVGFLGRVWRQGRPGWLSDCAEDPSFSRAAAARADGVHGYVAFPVAGEGEPAGVVEFFSRHRREPEPEFLALTAGLGHLIGQFITRKRLEAAHAYLAAIVESTEDAVSGQTLDGTIVSWNAGAEKLYGYSAAEAIGRSAAFLHPGSAHDPADILARIRKGRRVRQLETVHRTRDGRKIEVSLTVSPIRDASGAIVGASTIARDITERKRLERRLQAQSEQLQAQSQELEAQRTQLQLHNRELEITDRRKDEFLAMLAHELRNPLAPIVAAAQILKLEGQTDPLVQRQQSIIERQARHLTHLVDDLLDVSRITQGKIALRREPVAVAEIIEQSVQISRSLVEERCHDLRVSAPADALWVTGDLTRLVQVVANLLNNAAKYTEPGGRVWLSAECAGDEVVLRVRDTGAGIPAGTLPQVFDLFVQAERALDRSQGGLGVGLTLVRSLVQQHGGRVEARSDGPGRGSEFVVALPLLKDEGRGMRDEGGDGEGRIRDASSVMRDPSDLGGLKGRGSFHPSSLIPHPSLRVLLVEDNADAAETTSELLELWGIEHRMAPDGASAIRLIRDWEPDLALLDIGLPGMDGYELARRMRKETGAVLLAMTGYGTEEDRRLSAEAGFAHHLVKPVDPEELQRVLARFAHPKEAAAR
jgi:PAS domain S-box-containing protein